MGTVTRRDPGLNLKMDKLNYRQGTLDPYWAKFFRKVDKTFLEVGKKDYKHHPTLNIFSSSLHSMLYYTAHKITQHVMTYAM